MTDWKYVMLKPNLICTSLSSTSMLFSSEMFRENVSSAFTCIWRYSGHILVLENGATAAKLVYQTSPVGIDLFSCVTTFFCCKKCAWWLATEGNSLCRSKKNVRKAYNCWWLQTCGGVIEGSLVEGFHCETSIGFPILALLSAAACLRDKRIPAALNQASAGSSEAGCWPGVKWLGKRMREKISA